MRILFKTVLSIIVLAVLLAVFVPLGIGFWAKHQYPVWLQQINSQPQIAKTKVKFKLVKFNRGWFSSTAQLKISSPGVGNEYVVNQVIRQGPLFFIRDSKGRSHLQFGQIGAVGHSSSPLFKFYSLSIVNFGGHFHSKVSMPYFKHNFHSPKDWLSIKNVDLFLEGQLSSKKPSRYKVDLNIGRVTLRSTVKDKKGPSKIVLKFSGISVNTQFKKQLGMFYGHSLVGVDKIMLRTLGKKHTSFAANGLMLKANVAPDGDKTYVKYELGFKSIVGADRFKVGPAVLAFEFKKFDTAALSRFVKKVKELNKAHLPVKQANKALIKPALNVVAKGFEFNINELKIKLPQGSVDATAHVIIPASSDGRFNILQLMTQTKVSSNISISAQLVVDILKRDVKRFPTEKDAKLVVKQLIAAKILVLKKDQVTVHIRYENGKVLVNGLPFNPKELGPLHQVPPKP